MRGTDQRTSQSGRCWVRSWWRRRCLSSGGCREWWSSFLRKWARMTAAREWSTVTGHTHTHTKSLQWHSTEFQLEITQFESEAHHKCEGFGRHGPVLRQTVAHTHLHLSVLHTVTCGVGQSTHDPAERQRERDGGLRAVWSGRRIKPTPAVTEHLIVRWERRRVTEQPQVLHNETPTTAQHMSVIHGTDSQPSHHALGWDVLRLQRVINCLCGVFLASLRIGTEFSAFAMKKTPVFVYFLEVWSAAMIY